MSLSAPLPFPSEPAEDSATAADIYADFLGGAAGKKPAAARYLGIKDSALDDWMLPVGKPRGRGLPYFKIGKTVLFRRDSLDHWLNRQGRNNPAAA